MRRGIWSHWSGGVIGAILATVLCAGIGVTATFAARAESSAKQHKARADAAAAAAHERAVAHDALVNAVKFIPATSATNVQPDMPVAVQTTVGRLLSVRLESTDHSVVRGTLAVSGRVWMSAGSLDPSTAYRVTVVAEGADGVRAEVTSSFRTMTPAAIVGATLWPDDGMTVGVAQPVVIRFDHPITGSQARTGFLRHVTVEATHGVQGGWHWFSDTELHFRPKSFWPAGTRVAVAFDLSHWNAGNGMWGGGAHNVHFTIGPSHIATANLATHQMSVTENGRVIAVFPMSGGRPSLPTMNGTHIVLDRESVVHMVSSTNGIPVNSPDGYDELVYDDVHISDSGEYVHAAPWSVSSQGNANVSHGCINLSPDNALVFMNFSHIGDVVNVVGGPRPPAVGDHGVMDWDTDWSQWTPMRASVMRG